MRDAMIHSRKSLPWMEQEGSDYKDIHMPRRGGGSYPVDHEDLFNGSFRMT